MSKALSIRGYNRRAKWGRGREWESKGEGEMLYRTFLEEQSIGSNFCNTLICSWNMQHNWRHFANYLSRLCICIKSSGVINMIDAPINNCVYKPLPWISWSEGNLKIFSSGWPGLLLSINNSLHDIKTWYYRTPQNIFVRAAFTKVLHIGIRLIQWWAE